MKVYLTTGLDGIGEHDREAIQCDFEDQKVDFKVRGLKGKKGNQNLRLRLDPLGGTISPADCKINIKSNSISLTLRKADAGKSWKDVIQKAQ